MTVQPISLGARIRQLAAQDPDRIGLQFFPLTGVRRDLTYAELDRLSDQVATLLRSNGVRAGARVAIGLRNSPEHMAAVLGAWKLGAGIVTMRWDVPAWERDRMLAATTPAVVLSDHDDPGALVPVLDITRAWRRPAEPVDIQPPTQAMAIPTGGSTGASKAVVMPVPGELVPGATFAASYAAMGIEPADSHIIVGPLYHGNPLMMLHLGLFDGQRMLLMEKFDGPALLAIIAEHRPQLITLVPTMMRRLLDTPGIEDVDWSCFHAIIHGTAPCPQWLKRRWVELVGGELLWEIFGSTELVGTLLARGDEWVARPGTIGRPALGTELRLLDEHRREVAVGEIGEMFMRTGGLTTPAFDYLGSDRPNVIDGGFVSVGDLAWRDADGYVYSADRKGDLIITGGANVVPAEVEAALGEHDDIEDVVVLGLPDDDWGQRVHAIVQIRQGRPTPSESELRAFAKARLNSYKVPKSVEFVEQMPRSEMFKVRRAALAAERS